MDELPENLADQVENISLNNVERTLPIHCIRRHSVAMDQTDDRIPGEMSIDESGKLIRSYLKFSNVASPFIANYDNVVLVKIRKVIESRIINVVINSDNYTNNEYLDSKIIFRNYQVQSPTTKDGRPLYPITAVENGMTYTASISVDIEHLWQRRDNLQWENRGMQAKNVAIGSVPLMVRSSKCHLYGLTDKQLIEKGELEWDPFGYYISKGNKKLLVNQDKLRLNRFNLVYHKYGTETEKSPSCRIVTEATEGTNLIAIRRKVKVGIIELQLKKLGLKDAKQKFIPVFLPVVLLGELYNGTIDDFNPYGIDISSQFTYGEIEKRIKSFTFVGESRKKNRVFQESLQTFLNLSITGDLVTYYTNILLSKEKYDPTEARKSEAERRRNNLYRLVTSIFSELFPHMNGISEYEFEVLSNKANMLLIMTTKLCEFTAGYRQADDLDNWANKMIVTGAQHILKKFIYEFNKMIDEANKQISAPPIELGKNPAKYFVELTNQFGKLNRTLTEGFESSLGSNRWKVYGKVYLDLIETLNQDTTLAPYAHLMKLSASVNEKSKKIDPRFVNFSQTGYICIAATPESSKCGLVRELASTAFITTDRSEEPIARILSTPGFLNKQFADVNNPDMCIINGKFLGWCNGKILREIFLTEQIEGRLNWEASFVKTADKMLIISTDGGRLIRPLLIVNPDTNVPLIFEREEELKEMGINVWSEKTKFSEYLRYGLVRYVDALEQNEQSDVLIAQSINDLDTHRQEVHQMQTDLTNINIEIEKYKRDCEEQGLNLDTTKAEYKTLISERNQILKKLEDLKTLRYNLCEMDPSAIYGVSTSVVPYTNYTMMPRVSYQAAHNRQAMGPVRSQQMETTFKCLNYPSRPLIETQTHDLLGLTKLPAGQMAMVAIMSYAYNQEDAFIVNKAALDRGLFRYTVTKTYREKIIPLRKNSKSKNVNEVFRFPDIKDVERPQFHAISNDGTPILYKYVKEGDVIIAKVREYRENGVVVKTENVLTKVGLHEEGMIDRVVISHNLEGELVIKVRISDTRIPEIGDKAETQPAQKGVFGRIVSQENMPWSAPIKARKVINGKEVWVDVEATQPDMIISPHCLPSRMTLSTLIQMVTGIKIAMTTERVNATAFKPFNEADIFAALKQYGFTDQGNRIFHDGITGTQMNARIFMGPSYVLSLRHVVKDKIFARGRGAIHAVTRQPVHGKSRGGGLRLGEMEYAVLIAHGAREVIHERMLLSSNPLPVTCCKTCGIVAIAQHDLDELNQHSSSTYTCPSCKTTDIDDFTNIIIPATWMLLVLYNGARGIKMRFKFKDQN